MMAFSMPSLEPDAWLHRVTEKLGPVVVIRDTFNVSTLWTTDLKAIAYVLNNPQIYSRPEVSRYWFKEFIGDGLVVAEGETQQRQRRIMNPAFGAMPVREMTKIFVDVSHELCGEMRALCSAPANSKSMFDGAVKEQKITEGWTEIDMAQWTSRAALDMLSLAAFQYPLNTLQRSRSSNDYGLFHALEEVYTFSVLNFALLLLRGWMPLLRLRMFERDDTSARVKRLNDVVKKLAKRLIQERVEMIQEGQINAGDRDVLTLLVRAMLDGQKSRSMSEEEVIGQIMTLIVSGHETPAQAMVWALHSLSHAPEVQDKLRLEAKAILHNSPNPTLDELNSLPYLDNVVREALRLHSPGAWMERTPQSVDCIPVEMPYEDRYGNMRDHITISPGDKIRISVLSINRREDIWGPDAREFNPDRWDKLPQEADKIPGIIANSMAFSTGPRGCIGFRFAIAEMKAMLYILLREFEFEPAVPKEKVIRRPQVVSRPILRGEVASRLPIRVRPIKNIY
ncbi:related to Cytochrome P450 [Serendipita indica DSM 11827]|uniref:Related to Cytochrome P450 n=1 Tax=Serendipita indica (strain DSM 11827) TaxID=1109443 RepID=G4TPB7_SERID|nr:related to Cytochrome P450 [Serendipita indica DSM 11827]